MYRWNNCQINDYIKYLKTIDSDLGIVKDTIEILKSLKNKSVLKEYVNNIGYENEEYKSLIKYNFIMNAILIKYQNEKLDSIPYNKMNLDKKEVLYTIRDIFYRVDKEIAKVTEPFILDHNIINYSKNNPNCIFYLKYLNKFYISLNKCNNITEYTSSAHEFFHIYSTIKNPKFFDTIEYEFFGILGELIISNELKSSYFKRVESYKADINNYVSVLSYIKAIVLRMYAINNRIKDGEKVDYLFNSFNQSKESLKRMYKIPLSYAYSTALSYFLAIELFEIYKVDREKCIYLCNKIITSNKCLEDKLKDNNITLLEHSDDYIKKLVKVYEERT